jgi:hypothetical protein
LAAAEADEADRELFAVTDDSSELAELEEQLEKREK